MSEKKEQLKKHLKEITENNAPFKLIFNVQKDIIVILSVNNNNYFTIIGQTDEGTEELKNSLKEIVNVIYKESDKE